MLRPKATHEREHLRRSLGVEGAGGLVGEQQARIVGERAGERDALALSARQRRRTARRPVPEADLREELVRAPLALRTAPAAADHRHLHVLGRREHRHEVVELEDEPDRRGAVLRGVAELVDPLAADPDLARVGPVESADEVEQRALAAARGAGHGDELARGRLERDLVERDDAALLVGLPHPVDGELDAAHFTVTS
jgi:hypothetical protein